MDLRGLFKTTDHGSTNVLVITDRFSKLARAIPLASTTAPKVTNACLEHWVMPYGIPKRLLTDNGPQFVSKFFEGIRILLQTNHVASTPPVATEKHPPAEIPKDKSKPNTHASDDACQKGRSSPDVAQQLLDQSPPQDKDQNVVDRSMDYVDTEDSPYYKVRWWGFKAEEETWEPPGHIPANMRANFHNSEKPYTGKKKQADEIAGLSGGGKVRP